MSAATSNYQILNLVIENVPFSDIFKVANTALTQVVYLPQTTIQLSSSRKGELQILIQTESQLIVERTYISTIQDHIQWLRTNQTC